MDLSQTSAWVKTKSDEVAVKEGCYFDLAAAERVRQFFRKFIKHTTGQFAGQVFELLEWQWLGIIAPLFGWKQADGLRRFRLAYLSTPKKNGKSTLLAGLSNFLLLADNEPAAEIYSAAADREQASIIYREAAKMVEKSKPLSSKVRCRDSVKTMNYGLCFYKALSAEAKTKEGINAHGIFFDELHAQPGRELWDCLRYAGAARRQPLHITITTAGGDLNTICGEQYSYAKRVLGGEILDPTFFAYIAEADPKDDWSLESTWIKANPSYGITINAKDFKTAYLEAKESPAKENSFRRYRLNQWVQTADAWLSMDQWDATAGEAVNAGDLEGRECYAGLDLSATDDTTALVLLFADPDGGITLLPHFWLPEENIGYLERKHRSPYRAWAKQGLFNLTPGNVVDYQAVRAKVRELSQIYKIRELSIDRKFQGQAVETELQADGLSVVPAGQGWVSQDLPAKELEKLLKARLVRHGGHPVLRWHASNVVVDIDKANNYSINKKKSRSKIDGIAATLMALFCRMQDHKTATDLYSNEFPELTLL